MEDQKILNTEKTGTRKEFFRFMKENPFALLGSVLILIVILTSIFVPYLPTRDPVLVDLPNRLKPPSTEHLFGTDIYGRDVFSRVLWGGRISMLVGVLSVALSSLVGVVLGLISGYYGKILDIVIMRITDILLSFPALLLAMAICAALGSSLWNVIIAISIVAVPRFARLVRGSTLSVREEDFVEAARALGQKPIKIIVFHILPNVISPILVMVTLSIPAAIITEASLSFLGLGVMPPTPTWGNMISEGKMYLQNAPWIAIFSGTAIVLVVLAFNFVGDAARDAFDPRLRGEREEERG
ncbi:ABC transporter permease [bacterium]|nr:ABC transporter permease [bacterium]